MLYHLTSDHVNEEDVLIGGPYLSLYVSFLPMTTSIEALSEALPVSEGS